jgi:hypothetical protein
MSQIWLRRAAVALAVALPSLLLLVPKPAGRPSQQPPDDGRERDLARVYAALPEQRVYDDLRDWCGLRVTAVTPAEMDALAAALRIPQDEWMCESGPELRSAMREAVAEQPDRCRWVRIHHRTDPTQWIAVGMNEAMWSTGRPPSQVIHVRVPIGFRPAATT